MVGDSAWALIAQLSDRDAAIYLSSRRASGFNTVIVNLLEHKFARNAPADIRRVPPFTSPGDFSRPNPEYFDHAEAIVTLARRLGFLVLLTPAYAGYEGGNEGWWKEMVTMGPQRLRAYGRWVGQRFADHDNILWIEGGDYDVPDPALVKAVAEGIAESDPGALQTYNGAVDSRVDPSWREQPWYAVDNVYTYRRPVDAAAAAYRDDTKPFFLLEAHYENEHDATPLELRRQTYETVLSGGFGHVFGNNPMWHFDGPGIFPGPSDWRSQLHSPGTVGMTQFARIFGAMAWWKLRPDAGDFLLPDPSVADIAVAAVACDGSSAVVYDPSGSTLRLDLSALAGPATGAVWLDPVDGKSITAPLPPHGTGEPLLHPPGPNAGGQSDWLLVISSGTRTSR